MKIHSHYDLPPDVHFETVSPSRTQQHFAAECDINNIMAKYEKTGVLVDPFIPRTRQPLFDDFQNFGDFKMHQDAVARASEQFMSLDSRVRKRFNNDPAELLAFLSDDSNRSEAEKLNLLSVKETLAEVTETATETVAPATVEKS